MNTGFYEVFKQKLERQKRDLKKELERAKTERRQDWLKNQIKEAKKMRDLLKEMERVMGMSTHCPHCGGEL